MELLCTGSEIFPAMLAAISEAQESVQLETYIYRDDKIGRQFLEALLAAAQRGVRVSVLVDAAGSWFLPGIFFNPLVVAGAEVRRFNPLHLWRFGVRDHRKLLICDDSTIFIGGFNIADEYDGDGVTRGWCDLGMRLENPTLAKELVISFEKLFALSDFKSKTMGEFLPIHPGRGASPFQSALYQDLAKARDVRIISAYFFPTRRVRRELIDVVRRGGRVRLLLSGKSDVPVSQLAGQSLYHRLLKAGVEIYEYQPQILHAKLILADGIIYVGSSNLDVRSLNLNYELMLRFADKKVAMEGQEVFERALSNSKKIEFQQWRKARTFWSRWKNHWTHFLVARVDPFISLRQFRTVKN